MIRREAHALEVRRLDGRRDGRAFWTLDGEPLASVLEVLREVRFAVDPDFAPARLRIGPPPPAGGGAPEVRETAPRRQTDGAGGRTPVFVLTGFLGSGKTTLLNRLLRADALPDTAVVVNELGAIGIDHLLVASADDSVVELAGGCLCCAVRGDLALTLERSRRAPRVGNACAPFSRVLIETSGLADPTPIESLLLADPALAERMELAGITACVDATSGDAVLDRYPEAVAPGRRRRPPRDHQDGPRGPFPAALDERLRRLNPGRIGWPPSSAGCGPRAGPPAEPGRTGSRRTPFPFAAARARHARPCRRNPSGTRTGSTRSPSSAASRSPARPSPSSSAPSSSTRARGSSGSRDSPRSPRRRASRSP